MVLKELNLKELDINWDEYIIPQSDKKDVKIFQSILKEHYNYEPISSDEYDVTMFDSEVGVIDWIYEESSRLEKPKLDDRRISDIQTSLEPWDNGYIMCKSMLDNFMPTVVKEAPYKMMIGCSCGIYGKKPYDDRYDKPEISVMATINGTVGAAEGIVHELGHHKLHALGLDLEKYTDDFFENDFEEVFHSPVRFDKKRPISAVVHAEFSYIYVTEYYNKFLDWMLENEIGIYEQNSVRGYFQRQAYNLKRIGNGLNTIPEDMKVTDEGERFMESLLQYGTKVWYYGYEQLVNAGFDEELDWEPENGKPARI